MIQFLHRAKEYLKCVIPTVVDYLNKGTVLHTSVHINVLIYIIKHRSAYIKCTQWHPC